MEHAVEIPKPPLVRKSLQKLVLFLAISGGVIAAGLTGFMYLIMLVRC